MKNTVFLSLAIFFASVGLQSSAACRFADTVNSKKISLDGLKNWQALRPLNREFFSVPLIDKKTKSVEVQTDPWLPKSCDKSVQTVLPRLKFQNSDRKLARIYYVRLSRIYRLWVDHVQNGDFDSAHKDLCCGVLRSNVVGYSKEEIDTYSRQLVRSGFGKQTPMAVAESKPTIRLVDYERSRRSSCPALFVTENSATN